MTRALEGVCALLMLVMVVLLFLQVTTRYVLNDAPPWTEEFARGAFIYLTFVGAAVAVARGAHLRVDTLTAALSAPTQRLLRIVCHLLAILFLLFVLYYGVVMVGELAGQPLVSVPISKGWFFAGVPVGAAVMLVYEALRLRDVLRGEAPVEPRPGEDPASMGL